MTIAVSPAEIRGTKLPAESSKRSNKAVWAEGVLPYYCAAETVIARSGPMSASRNDGSFLRAGAPDRGVRPAANEPILCRGKFVLPPAACARWAHAGCQKATRSSPLSGGELRVAFCESFAFTVKCQRPAPGGLSGADANKFPCAIHIIVHCGAPKSAWEFIQRFLKAMPHNRARALGERFCSQSRFGKWRNALCISHFPN